MMNTSSDMTMNRGRHRARKCNGNAPSSLSSLSLRPSSSSRSSSIPPASSRSISIISSTTWRTVKSKGDIKRNAMPKASLSSLSKFFCRLPNALERIKPMRFHVVIFTFLLVFPLQLTTQQQQPQQFEKSNALEITPTLLSETEDLTTVLIVNTSPPNHQSLVNGIGRLEFLPPDVGPLISTTRTFIQGGVTTQYATQVVGTTLENGRVYAQYLKKSSRVLYEGHETPGNGGSATIVTGGTIGADPYTRWVGDEATAALAELDWNIGGGASDGVGIVLPQSHNDLLNADQSDWRTIEETNAAVPTGKPKPIEHVVLAVSGNRAGSTIPLDKSARQLAAQRVLPIGDLPTYTVKNHFAPSSYSTIEESAWSAGGGSNLAETEQDTDLMARKLNQIDHYSTYHSVNRSPKVFYKTMMISAGGGGKQLSASGDNEVPTAPFITKRNMLTTTYYGFADFTTIVGDSVIVFSPHTAAPTGGQIAGQITSIKGEATLHGGGGITTILPHSTVDVTRVEEKIAPAFTQQQSSELDMIVKESAAATTEDISPPLIIPTTVVFEVPTTTSSSPSTTLVDLFVETTTLPTTTTSGSGQDVETTLLSRPSDEEIRRIYASLSSAAAAAAAGTDSPSSVAPVLEVTSEQQPTVPEPTSTMTGVSANSSMSVSMLGGATTIFLEDDPFANFVESTPALLAIAPSMTTTTTTSAVVEAVIVTGSEAGPGKTEGPGNEATTQSAVEQETTSGTTSGQIAQKDSKPIIISEDIPEDCPLRTSQVFLTQLPVTKTLLSTSYADDGNVDGNGKQSVIVQTNVVATYEIAEATKLYCIQQTSEVDESEDITQQPPDTSTTPTTSVVTSTIPIEMDTVTPPEVQTRADVDDEPKSGSQGSSTTTPSTTTALTDDDAENVSENTAMTATPDDQEEQVGQMESNSEDDSYNEDDEEEVELIYKTLYTTYTYLTTFFHDESTTSISSHTEVLTNVITSTLNADGDISEVIGSTYTDNHGSQDTDLTSSATELYASEVEGISSASTRFTLPKDLLKSTNTNSNEVSDSTRIVDSDSSDIAGSDGDAEGVIRKTYYTTYTYYTTIFAESQTDIMSHTEVFSNFVDVRPTAVQMGPDSTTTANATATLEMHDDSDGNDDDPEHNDDNESDDESAAVLATRKSNINYSTMVRTNGGIVSRSEIDDNLFGISNNEDIQNNGGGGGGTDDDGEYSEVLLTTSSTSSSSASGKMLIGADGMIIGGEQQLQARNRQQTLDSAIDDQISSESNTEEIIPAATLVLQTSFTTFTYYTTMYSGESSNVISRLETITNMITETLPASTGLIAATTTEEASLPITYFTTFTYWTRLTRDSTVTTFSREETISNVVQPDGGSTSIIPTSTVESIAATVVPQSGDGIVATTPAAAITAAEEEVMEMPLLAVSQNEVDIQPHPIATSTTTNADESTTTTEAEASSSSTTVVALEPTTYYTTYTYYTTSYETNRTITNSRFETLTNVVIPTSIVPPASSSTSSVPKIAEPKTLLYDYKKIIDADGVSTLFFTTSVLETINAEGATSQLVRSESRLEVDSIRKTAAATATPTDIILLTTEAAEAGSGSAVTRQYRTGLVRLIDGTRIANDTTTLYQSRVIGTVIKNRYAQIIESTSSFLIAPEVTATLAASSGSAANAPDGSTSITPTSVDIGSATGTGSSSAIPATVPGIDLHGSNEDENIAEAIDEEDGDEDGGGSAGGHVPGQPFGSRRRTFTPVIRPFASRNRPQFAPKRKSGAPSSATIITRNDFTPTITATPALKSTGGFSGGRFGGSSRRGGSGSINSTPISTLQTQQQQTSTSVRRFGRPGGGVRFSSIGGASRSQLASSAGGSGAISSSSLRRPSGVLPRPSAVPSGSYRGGVGILSSAAGPFNSRLRIKPTLTVSQSPFGATSFGAGVGPQPGDVPTAAAGAADNTSEEDGETGGATTADQAAAVDVDENAVAGASELGANVPADAATTRRNQNPLLRFRRPLNRPAGFTPAAGNSPTNRAAAGGTARPSVPPSTSTRRNPLTGRARSSTTVPTSTTSTTARPRPRSFQRPPPATIGGLATSGGRPRPPGSTLFPQRGLLAQKTAEDAAAAAAKGGKKEDGSDDSEYEEDDDEDNDDDDEETEETGGTGTGAAGTDAVANRRRRRSQIKAKNAAVAAATATGKTRTRRSAETSLSTRSNFRNRFRRPKPAASGEDGTSSTTAPGSSGESDTDKEDRSTTSEPRSRVGYGSRYNRTATSGTERPSSTSGGSFRAIRPTRPSSSGGRVQFTLREKDASGGGGSSSESSTTRPNDKLAGLAGRSSTFRRPQTSAVSRRRPTTAGSGSSGTDNKSSSSGVSIGNSNNNGNIGGNTSTGSTTGRKRRLKSYTKNDNGNGSGGGNGGSGNGGGSGSNGGSAKSRSSSRVRSGTGSTRSNRRHGHHGHGHGHHHSNGGGHRGRAEYAADGTAPPDGTITVTHLIPAEVTIPVVNGKVTEYRNIVTGKTSTEVLGPMGYTNAVGSNGQTTLVLSRQDSSINYSGATEFTQFVLHPSATTTITFTPTTIRGRKTSFSHVIPSTVYSVETLVSTVQPQLAANAPLANILLSQLLLGNIGGNPLLTGAAATAALPAVAPLDVAVGAAVASAPAMGSAVTVSATPVTEFRTHVSTYVTTVFEGMSTVLPVTFQGKKIITTVYDSTAQTITATEFITDTIVTTPTVLPPAAQQQAPVQNLLLQQLLQQQLLNQQLQQQAAAAGGLNFVSIGQQKPLDQTQLLLPLLGDNLQELDGGAGGGREDDLFGLADDDGSGIDAPIGAVRHADDHKSVGSNGNNNGARKKPRKGGKNRKQKQSLQREQQPSSVITLYVSGRRPGEFSTILSTIHNDATELANSSGGGGLHKRQAPPPPTRLRFETLQQTKLAQPTVEEIDFYATDGSEHLSAYIVAPPLPPIVNNGPDDINDVNDLALNLIDSDADMSSSGIDFRMNDVQPTATLDRIVGEMRVWHAAHASKLHHDRVAVHTAQASPFSVRIQAADCSGGNCDE